MMQPGWYPGPTIVIKIMYKDVRNNLDIIPCNPVKVNGHFKETYHLHLQSGRVSKVGNQHEVGSNPEHGGDTFLRSVG
jgi:hypothetical protein